MKPDQTGENARWQVLEALLSEKDYLTDPAQTSELSRRYQEVAAALMRERQRGEDADAISYLNDLAHRTHNVFYSLLNRKNLLPLVDWLLEFPGAVRRQRRFMLWACGLFFGPYLFCLVGAYLSPEFANLFLADAQLKAMEVMHSKLADGSAVSSSASMTGFYIGNNVGIAFRCFAGGIIFCVGAAGVLVFNGIFLGVVEGHLYRSGLAFNINTFTAAHSPWELLAIALSGAAGLQLGWALIATGGLERFESVKRQGLEILRILTGAAAYMTFAAFLEAWISPSALPPPVKWGMGLLGAYVAVRTLVAGAE